MRTTKELLEVMLENIDFLREGLCVMSFDLRYDKIITEDEETLIDNYLFKNIRGARFCLAWPKGEKEPRIKWLKEQIEKLSKDTINN